jgi:hypothetical protein
LNFDHNSSATPQPVVEILCGCGVSLGAQMKIERTSLNEITATVDANDDMFHAVRDAVAQARGDMNCWNLILVMPTQQWSEERMRLQDMGFIPAGNVSIDAHTLIRMRLAVRRSSDGGTLAVETPSNGPTDTEIDAVQELLNKHPEYARVWKKFTEAGT